MKALGLTMLSLSLAGLCAAGPLAAQTKPTTPQAGPTPNCQPATAPQKVEGQVVEINSTGDKIKVRDTSGVTHEFQASPETVRDLKKGDRIEATLRPLPKCS
jgi:Cu/Ag efflux protein CusF